MGRPMCRVSSTPCIDCPLSLRPPACSVHHPDWSPPPVHRLSSTLSSRPLHYTTLRPLGHPALRPPPVIYVGHPDSQLANSLLSNRYSRPTIPMYRVSCQHSRRPQLQPSPEQHLPSHGTEPWCRVTPQRYLPPQQQHRYPTGPLHRYRTTQSSRVSSASHHSIRNRDRTTPATALPNSGVE